jgi:hypothetical protein
MESAIVLNDGYDKHQNYEQNHVLTDKGALVTTKGDVNTNASSSDIAANTDKPVFDDIKGGINTNDALASGNIVKPGSIAIDQPVVAGGAVVKENTGVKVIKYYSADSKPAASLNTTNAEVKSDRGARGNGYNTVSKPVNSNNNPSGLDSKPSKGTYYTPSGDQGRQQGTIKQNTNQAPSKNYEQPKSNSGSKNTYEQPKSNGNNKSYEQPSKPSRPTYEAPKSSGSSSGSKPTYNSGSSNRNSGSSSGTSSKPSSSGSSAPKKRSGGN